MTHKQFNEQYPDYTGFVFITSGFYLDSKLKEQLDENEIKYIELNINFIHHTFLKIIEPNIGPNLLFFKNGEIKNKIKRVGPLSWLMDFIKETELKS